MSIKITNVRLSAGGYLDEHITELKWGNYEGGKHGESARSTLVEWIDGGGKAFVEARPCDDPTPGGPARAGAPRRGRAPGPGEATGP